MRRSFVKSVYVFLLALSVLASACKQGSGEAMEHGLPEGAIGTEYLQIAVAEPIAAPALDALFGQLFTAGGPAFRHEVAAGLALLAEPEGDPDVVRLRYELTSVKGDVRKAATIPVGRAVALRFAALVKDVLARMDPASTDPNEAINLELRAHGEAEGTVALRVSGLLGNLKLTHTVRGAKAFIGAPGYVDPTADPAGWSAMATSVGFEVKQDELNFFVDKAYGRGAAEGQSFDHFVLGAPHDWLNVTVTPWAKGIDASRVAFETALADGSRFSFASAPASKPMGALFIEAANRAMTNMLSAEEKIPGSSEPFEVPYFYDDPEGGTVQVRLTGKGGKFVIYYDLESVRTINGAEPPALLPAGPDAGVRDGSGAYGEGKLSIRFAAAESVLSSSSLKDPLHGTIYASVYRSEDVVITGPVAGAKSLFDLRIDDADLAAGAMSAATVTDKLPAGPVKILGFFDVDGNATSGSEEADDGDPVTLPITDYTVAADATTEVTVLFDLVR